MRIDASISTWFVGLSALSVLAGCPGTLAHKELYEAALDASRPNDVAGATTGCGDVPTRIFVPSCGGTSCHGADAPQQDLDLVSPGVADRVVGIAGKGCAVTLADPADPEGSLLYLKLAPIPPCGSPMPLARPPLSQADIACVRAWIAAQ
jgi:hypothetical protein